MKESGTLKNLNIMCRSKGFYVTITVLLLALYGAGQTSTPGKYMLPGVVSGGDTMANVIAKVVVIIPPGQNIDNEELKQYKRLVKNIKVVYPYALVGKKVFHDVQRGLDSIRNKKERKIFIKNKEKELMTKYAGELKRLSVTQGQLLMKLVDRELHKTSYEIIKEMRGSLQAILWQQLAKLFGSDLKATYDPGGEDMVIEHIIMMIEAGQL
jgi:hypothetical protein